MTGRLARAAGWAAVMVLTILLLLIPADRHVWMQAMDPTIRPGDIQDLAGDGRLVATVFVVVGEALLALLFATGRTPARRAMALVVAVAIATIWAVRFR